MQDRVAAIRAGTAGELVWLVEHPPLYTAGTSARPERTDRSRRFPTFAAGRGGQWTYHGPGQRIAYVMLDLTRPHGAVPARDCAATSTALEEWLIRALDRFNVQGERREGRVGIWVADRAARHRGQDRRDRRAGHPLGELAWRRAQRRPGPGHFAGIVPCGIREHGVTSLHALGIPATMAEADVALRAAWDEVFGDAVSTGSCSAPSP